MRRLRITRRIACAYAIPGFESHHTWSRQSTPRNVTLTHELLQVHKLCQEAAQQILDDFKPNLMIAIGGGGYVPARILRYAPLVRT